MAFQSRVFFEAKINSKSLSPVLMSKFLYLYLAKSNY